MVYTWVMSRWSRSLRQCRSTSPLSPLRPYTPLQSLNGQQRSLYLLLTGLF